MFIRTQNFQPRADELGQVLTRLFMACCLGCGVVGCGGATEEVTKTPRPDLSQSPLTVSVWEQSPDIEKYDPQVLAQLRADNPELKSTEGWKKFYTEVVLPGFRSDVLKQPPASKE